MYPGAHEVLTRPLIVGAFVNLDFSYGSVSHAETPDGFVGLVFPQGFKFEQINSGLLFFPLIIFDNVLLLDFNSLYFEIFCGGEKYSHESRGQEI